MRKELRGKMPIGESGYKEKGTQIHILPVGFPQMQEVPMMMMIFSMLFFLVFPFE